jgi:hypothetical protein
MQRAKQEGGPAGPVRQGRAIEVDALAGVDLGLAIERQMIGVLGSRITPSSILGQRNWPSSSRLAKKQSPEPSHQISLTRSARLARNT